MVDPCSSSFQRYLGFHREALPPKDQSLPSNKASSLTNTCLHRCKLSLFRTGLTCKVSSTQAWLASSMTRSLSDIGLQSLTCCQATSAQMLHASGGHWHRNPCCVALPVQRTAGLRASFGDSTGLPRRRCCCRRDARVGEHGESWVGGCMHGAR